MAKSVDRMGICGDVPGVVSGGQGLTGWVRGVLQGSE